MNDLNQDVVNLLVVRKRQPIIFVFDILGDLAAARDAAHRSSFSTRLIGLNLPSPKIVSVPHTVVLHQTKDLCIFSCPSLDLRKTTTTPTIDDPKTTRYAIPSISTIHDLNQLHFEFWALYLTACVTDGCLKIRRGASEEEAV